MAKRIRALPNLTFRRIIRLTIGLAPLVLLGIFATLATPGWVFWQIGLVFLIVIEGLFALAATLSLFGAIVCGVALRTGKRERARQSVAGRGLLLATAILAALTLAEAASAVLQYRYHRRTALPVGGLREIAAKTDGVHLASLPAVDQFPSGFPDDGDDRQIDILVLGESSAEGVPLNRWLSIGKLIQWKLEEVFGARPVSLVVRATSRETLELQQAKLQRISRRPELMIVYCGHNEFSARLPESRDLMYYLDDTLPTTGRLLLASVEALSPFCRMVRENIEKCRIAIPPPPGGNRALIDSPVYRSAEYATLLIDFRRRLELLVCYAEKLGSCRF